MKKIIYFFKNYWYYYKIYAIIAAFVLFAAGITIYEKVTYEKPDMIIDCLSDNLFLTSDTITAICEDIENSGCLEDINGDEKVRVSFSTYSAGASDSTLGTDGGSAYELMEIKMAVGNSAIIVADKKVIERYEKYNIYKDISEIAEKLSVPGEDVLHSSNGTLIGIRVDNRGILNKLGLSGKEVFLTLRVPMDSTDDKMIEQAPAVAEYMLK